MTIAKRCAEALFGSMTGPVAKVFLKRRGLFAKWQAHGYHVVPNHFYQPIPDTTTLDDARFAAASAMPGVDMRLDYQLRLMHEFRANFAPEFDALPDHAPEGTYHLTCGMFGPVDAEILHAMIRTNRPRRIIEIGSGYSTLVAANAIAINKRLDPTYDCELTCIEPYPRDWIAKGFPGLSTLIRQPVQAVPLSLFASLQENDILFIDSSHVLKIGSDVQYEFLEVIPRLDRGVLVHIHDIFFPREYPRQWVQGDLLFWTEQYLLHAFLMFNRAFQVEWCGNYVDHFDRPGLERAFPSLARHRSRDGTTPIAPGSFWMRRIEPPPPPPPHA